LNGVILPTYESLKEHIYEGNCLTVIGALKFDNKTEKLMMNGPAYIIAGSLNEIYGMLEEDLYITKFFKGFFLAASFCFFAFTFSRIYRKLEADRINALKLSFE